MSCTIKAMHGDTMVTPTGIEMRRRYMQAAHANARALGRGPPNEGNPE